MTKLYVEIINNDIYVNNKKIHIEEFDNLVSTKNLKLLIIQ